MSSLEHELHCRLISRVAFKDAKGFLRPVEFPAGDIPTETAGRAQPLRFRQIGFAALQLGGPFRHLRLEFVAGLTKLLLAHAYRFLGAGASRIRTLGPTPPPAGRQTARTRLTFRPGKFIAPVEALAAV